LGDSSTSKDESVFHREGIEHSDLDAELLALGKRLGEDQHATVY